MTPRIDRITIVRWSDLTSHFLKPCLRFPEKSADPHVIGRERDVLRFEWLDLLARCPPSDHLAFIETCLPARSANIQALQNGRELCF